MSKKSGGKKKRTTGTYKARCEKMLESAAAYRVKQPPKPYKTPHYKPKKKKPKEPP